MPAEKIQDASYRNDPLRRIQTALQGFAPDIINFMYRKGMLYGTVIADALDSGEPLHPDQVTLTGVQLITKAGTSLAEHGGWSPVWETIKGNSFDALDGMVAKSLKLASPDGAVKDVLADRVVDGFFAEKIAQKVGRPDYSPAQNAKELKIAFNLSTLTKATSEMAGVQTREGGLGSMLQRRKKLLFILKDIGDLNNTANLRNSEIVRQRLSKIRSKYTPLIEGGHQRALQRIEQIKQAPRSAFGFDNPALYQEDSSAAVEARKYAAVARLSEITGLDMVGELNSLAGEELFPRWQDLAKRHNYIEPSLEKTEPFLRQALEIAGIKATA